MVLTATRDPRALERFNETIRRCYNEREWLVLEATLEAAPELLAPRDPAAAATIFGYLEDSPAPFAVYLRVRSIEVINALPDNETYRRRGAAMDRHEIVALTLAALEDS